MPVRNWQQQEVFSGGDPILTDTLRNRLFEEVIPNCPNLIFLLLTKRPSNINRMVPNSWLHNPPSNVMFGASASDQKTYNNALRHLCNVSGYRFMSIEPQIAPVNIDYDNEFIVHPLDWIIQGGESGSKDRRPFNLDWARSMSAQRKDYEIPYFMKQVDKITPVPEELLIREFPLFHSQQNIA